MFRINTKFMYILPSRSRLNQIIWVEVCTRAGQTLDGLEVVSMQPPTRLPPALAKRRSVEFSQP
jgi:hypothetical protein